ncbi:hypothetical protein [Nocardioides sp. W7]|uniref:hypothetical protein n=1 Tax=Nocardioides sp. W7 TaxID=2931390 RepID=UPI001FD3F526|nr:hypothetical protein [Nocardioides sp. W7]
MESDRLDPQQARRIAERAEAAPYIDYPPTPWWYAPAAGLWAGALILLIGLAQDRRVLALVGLLALVALEGAFLAWYSRYHGALPSLRHAPAEFRPAFVRYGVGVAVVLALVVGSWLLAGAIAAAVVAGVAVTVGLVLYERTFARAAARTRARLA